VDKFIGDRFFFFQSIKYGKHEKQKETIKIPYFYWQFTECDVMAILYWLGFSLGAILAHFDRIFCPKNLYITYETFLTKTKPEVFQKKKVYYGIL
jgi:hypothetical protein